MNMLERKKLKSRSHGVSEFLVRYRRTYVLKNMQLRDSKIIAYFFLASSFKNGF